MTKATNQPKDEGLIASEADFLNTELRMNYGDHLQVGMENDWRPAIRGLVDGVRYGEEFNHKKLLSVVKEAWMELVGATGAMIPSDEQIICDRVKRAEELLRDLVND